MSKKAYFIAALVMAFYLAQPSNWHWWPPPWVEHRAQSKVIAEQVERAGGWNALRKHCCALFDGVTLERESNWRAGHDLPSGLSSLHPRSVEMGLDADHTPTVYLKFFDWHSTGGHNSAVYGLVIRCGSTPAQAPPKIIFIKNYEDDSWISVTWDRCTRAKVSDGIYEVY